MILAQQFVHEQTDLHTLEELQHKALADHQSNQAPNEVQRHDYSDIPDHDEDSEQKARHNAEAMN